MPIERQRDETMSDCDRVATALRNAPVDDEPESEEEKQQVAEAHHWLSRNGGKGVPHDDAMRRLELS